MEIKEVKIISFYSIEVVENGHTDYYRRSIDSNSWEVLMGDSWENLIEADELESEFQRWASKGLNTDFLNRI